MLEKRGRKQGFFFGKVLSALMTFLLIVTTCVSAGMPVYAGDEDYDVEATGKLTDGGKTANVVVSLTNHGDNFGGYLRLCVSDRYGHNDYLNGYECYVAVAEEETDTVTISFPVIEGMDLENAKFELQILNEKKTPLQYEKLYHLFDADASAHIGILCDDPSALDYLVNYNSSGYGYYSYSGNDRKWESQALMPSELTDEITLTTISMIVIGIQLGTSDFKRIIKNKSLMIESIVKMIFTPLITILLVNWLPISNTIKLVAVFGAAFPSAVAVTPIAQTEGKNTLLSAEGVAFTTLLSLATIPLTAYIASVLYL